MIIEALSQQGLEMGKDFFFILNSSAHDYFDYEKECAKKMIDCGNTVMLAGGENESNSTLLVDVLLLARLASSS
ncbi:hypothetical protein EB796_005824 [Bugula neritina]|uniref:Uncharacterized protein n=1 Tax=Bugula neritina TaxID=10212 RepID=A0A7J7KD55_BUGNE|nr:hypothetical protein EB796_005824 [Bugula neritina]